MGRKGPTWPTKRVKSAYVLTYLPTYLPNFQRLLRGLETRNDLTMMIEGNTRGDDREGKIRGDDREGKTRGDDRGN
ncbi:unnamed protein product [Sphagnum troendelagicum]|uniref:Uncharacterized protein n=1 Tax=Sphagnum troendelagicum TaxID=128251 RepID=A0ABP0TRS2_9BRYO